MYEWSTGAAAEVTLAHVLLSSRKMVRQGESVLVPPDQRRRGDPRMNSVQQGTSERRKEREGGREGKCNETLGSEQKHVSFLDDGEGEGGGAQTRGEKPLGIFLLSERSERQ